MSNNLNEFLVEKRRAIEERNERASQADNPGPTLLRASTRAEGRSGIRRIRIRDFQIISDSGPDFAGYDLGPTSPELQLGVLSSCLTHVFLIHAASRNVPLDALKVDVQAQIDSRGGKPGFENIPVYPHNISYTVSLSSSASDADLKALHEAVEQACPILNLLLNPQPISGTVLNTAKAAEADQTVSAL